MIERLYVNNFRCLENFSIDLATRPSLLVIGKNGSGKSTMRRALGLFQSICRGANRARDLVSEGDFTQQRKEIPMRFEVDLVLAKRRFKYAISFEMPPTFREARIAEELLSVDGQTVFSREGAQVSLGTGNGFSMDWHVAALPVVNESPKESAIREIRSFFASMILIAPIPSNMSGFSEEESADLAEDANNFSAWLRALLSHRPAAYTVIDAYLKSVIPDFESFEHVHRSEEGRQLRVKFEPKELRRAFVVDFKQLSDGEKCFFLSALIVACNKVSSPVFCMWDEPDNHLSLSEVRHFVTQLRRMANQNGQFIATSHHPETIRGFSDESTFVFSRKSHLEPTVVRALAELPYTGDLVEAIIRDEIAG